MTVETIVVRGSGESRRALQHYTTDGKTSVSTGADGDEFHTAVVWSGSCLIFSLEEHEDGRIILSRETWTLSENGDMIERCREGNGTPQRDQDRAARQINYLSPGSAETVISATRVIVVIGDYRWG